MTSYSNFSNQIKETINNKFDHEI
ncbi:hypothetical protein AAY15_004615, partial [Escherichia coli]